MTSNAIPFPMLILAGVIVSAGIYVVDQFDSRAAWLLAFLVLLGVAFGYKGFGDEITSLFAGVATNQQSTPSSDTMPTTTPADVVVGPLGPVMA